MIPDLIVGNMQNFFHSFDFDVQTQNMGFVIKQNKDNLRFARKMLNENENAQNAKEPTNEEKEAKENSEKSMETQKIQKIQKMKKTVMKKGFCSIGIGMKEKISNLILPEQKRDFLMAHFVTSWQRIQPFPTICNSTS